ncbi:MAG: protein phosphatase 2C domain-containing protein [Oscillospiraceae bacterium]|nr:protein phosphatase 2C domain-containing protein [Oscillospiraceae bacterium]
MDYALISETGTRDNNEDSVAVLETDAGSLFVVADGLGGHGKGEVASALATESFVLDFSDYDGDIDIFLSDAFMNAQNNIMHAQTSQGGKSDDMKTTCVALLVADGLVRIGHVGDARAYLFNKNKLKTRTRDHSVVEMLVVSGEIREKHINKHPDRNRLLRTMGIEWESPQYALADDIPLPECQAFLLCTDGFWELCSEKKMCAYLKKSKTAKEWLDLMTDEVEKNGQGNDMDNYTAIAVLSK